MGSREHKNLTILIWMITGAIAAPCPLGWYDWRDSCYTALKEKLTWFDAVTACQRLGGGLMVPNSEEEHKFILKVRRELFSGFSYISKWIGCDLLNRNLQCIGGQNAYNVYTNWYSTAKRRYCVAM